MLEVPWQEMPRGSLFEDQLVDDLLLLKEIVEACRSTDDAALPDWAHPPPAA